MKLLNFPAVALACAIAVAMVSCAGDGSTLDRFGNPLGPPKILISPSPINISVDKGKVANLELTIKNVGGFDLTITQIEAEAAWIRVEPLAAAIKLAAGDSVLLPVAIGQTSLNAGTFFGGIRVSSNDEETPVFNLAITLNITEEVLPFEPTLANIQRFVFSPICVECHSGAKAPKGLKLEADDAYKSLVNVPSVEKPEYLRVKPFDPDNSYLVRKLEGGPDIADKRMPLDRPPLPREQIRVIRRWIAGGALKE
ncbi:MAG: hypothetical protein ONB48_03520 [candidate division KSB1 bacterium]|nr:hypothetical protein [candidate division KSB1 bacterium]MDZ7275591.1 hypothetical protein [candidate division KSB1 bacterium]MDZ7284718.1 hypothetical protein [candidate division KSB1 bacterium]MDZ7297863.1 hypothetical protein [candidate division KSB1 bacterium]MDZ7309560.1 hypothetical protein [candidate division KSB1 bacterium]